MGKPGIACNLEDDEGDEDDDEEVIQETSRGNWHNLGLSKFLFIFSFLAVMANHLGSHLMAGDGRPRSPASSSAGGSSNFGDSLIKIVLLLLSGLLLANSVLFYKMWWLEAKVGCPLSNLEEVLITTAREHGGTLDRETWLKVLQRQEAAHQLELQKWHDLLGSAASLLKQTEESLTNLQKSIQPLALQKLKGLLDLQEQLANNQQTPSTNNNHKKLSHHEL